MQRPLSALVTARSRKCLAIVVIGLVPVLACCDSANPAWEQAVRRCEKLEPAALIPLLGDEVFAVRECAEERLHQLLGAQPAGGPNAIEQLCLRIYQTTPDPEIRMRARAVLADFATNQWSPDAFFGVATTASTEFDDEGKLHTWLEITKLLPNGPGARAGLQQGDRIERVDNAPFKEGKADAQLDERIAAKQAGDTLAVEFLRDGQRQTVAVTLACRPRTVKGTADKPPPTPEECLRQYLKAQRH